MTDRQLATRWDADQRLAATVCFVAGVAVIVGAALWLSVGMLPAAAIVQGEGAGAPTHQGAQVLAHHLDVVVVVEPALAVLLDEGHGVGDLDGNHNEIGCFQRNDV